MDKVKTGYYQRTVHQIPFYKSSMIGSNILMTWNFCDRKYGFIRTYLRILKEEIVTIMKLSD